MIYLDHNATTPLAPEVLTAMAGAWEVWGNPSSVHTAGRRARDAVERARAEVAALIGAQPEEIVFTSGGSEGDNLAIRGLARAARRSSRSGHVVSSPLEHPAVLGALDELRAEGFAVTLLPVGPRGEISAEDLRAALRDDTVLVTLSAANHELGNLYPVAVLAAIAHQRGALFHSDAVQMVGRLPFDVGCGAIDAITLSAHKIFGPKGVGAVYLRRGCDCHPLVAGGHQEGERRAGTENVPGIVGFAEACRLARRAMAAASDRTARLGQRLEERLLSLPGARLHGDGRLGARVPGVVNVGFDGADGQLVMVGLDLEGICVSTGAACTSGTLAPSSTLRALGLSLAQAREAVRFSLGRDTTEQEIDRAARVTAMVVERVRAASREAA